jgi:hypothetical protein
MNRSFQFSSRARVGAGIFMIASQICLVPSAAAQSQFGNNIYILVRPSDPFAGANNSWFSASAAAASSTYNGVQGHLATVTSQAENTFLLGLSPGFQTFTGAWLGGKSPEGWLQGPEIGQGFTYTNWGGIEPNNSGYAYMNIGASAGGIGSGQWADDSGVQGFPDPTNDPVVGYFVEFENAAVPEPATLIALAVPSLALLRRRRSLS